MIIKVLGPLEVSIGDRLLPLKGDKQKAFLGLLAIHANEAVDADDIVSRLWDEDVTVSGRACLRRLASALRGALSGQEADDWHLVESEYGYQLSVPIEAVDLHVSRRLAGQGRRAYKTGHYEEASTMLRRAVQTWRGPALTGVNLGGPEWPELAELREESLTLLEDRIEADLMVGRIDVIDDLREAIRMQPFRERLHALLMLALAIHGRPSEALAVYDDVRGVLVEECGVDPGTELRELREQVIRRFGPRSIVTQPAPPSTAGAAEGTALLCRLDTAADDSSDPERRAELIDWWNRCLGEVTRSFSGRAVAVMDSTVVMFFDRDGHPARAVRAALAVQAMVSAGRRNGSIGAGVTARVTAASGTARALSSGPADGAPMLAGTAFTAGRALLSAATPGVVLVAEGTYRSTSDVFAYQRVGSAPGCYEARSVRRLRAVPKPVVAVDPCDRGAA